MAEITNNPSRSEYEALDKAKDFWAKYGKGVLIALGAIVVLGGGWLAYKSFVKDPKEAKANDAIWRSQLYFGEDSLQKALKGDGPALGAERVASQYDGTKQGNLANYYAGVISLRSGDNDKAVKYLKDFSTDSKIIQARAYKLLADAYANLNKNSDALANYKKAAHEFEQDFQGSAEYLFYAGYFADKVMNDKKAATEIYQELVKKFPGSSQSADAEKFLAQAGVYKSED